MEPVKPPPTKHVAERLFESLLRLRGYSDFAHEENPKDSRQPDYRVTIDGQILHFEVKSFDEPQALGGSISVFDPIAPIREKIEIARPQFRRYKNFPCALVLFNAAGRLVFLHDMETVYGAMFGDPAWQLPFDPETHRFGRIGGTVFTKNGKMVHAGRAGARMQNSTFSAILALQPFRDFGGPPIDPDTHDQIGVFVYENPFARRPFPRTVFRGEWDRIFGRLEDAPETIGAVHVGARVPIDTRPAAPAAL